MSRTATEAYPNSWRQHFLLETDDGQYVPLIVSDPRTDQTKVQVFRADSTWKAKGCALKVEMNHSTPPAFSAHRSISAELTARAYAPQETLAQPKVAPLCGYSSRDLPRRELFAMVSNRTPFLLSSTR